MNTRDRMNGQDISKPLYRQLMSRLRSDIASGKYPVHSRIPSEQELCTVYEVSRVTVRKALAELTKEGLVERHQGKGTFVAVPRLHRNLSQITSFHESCRMMGSEPGTEVIHAHARHATEEEAAALQIAAGEELIEIQRLRLADGQPVAMETNRFPGSYRWLLDQELEHSLYALLKERKIEPEHAVHEISLTQADAGEAELLQVEPGTALLCLNEVIYDKHGKPIHTSLQKIRGDRFVFRI